MGAQVDEMIMRGAPQTLSDDELELDASPLTKPPIPIPARAWVRYGYQPIRIDVEVVAWTPNAVAVRWRTAKGEQHRAWVWASAVASNS